MLEVRKYPKDEIAEILHTSNNQGIARKLDRLGVAFSYSGRGSNRVFDIKEIPAKSRFKVFCVIDLGMSTQTDFTKFRNFVYYFMNDEDFRQLPNETLERRMAENGVPVSRQTIMHYKEKMAEANLIADGDYIYYFARGGQQNIVNEEKYKAAWGEYWENKDKMGSREAMAWVCAKYGGYPRKQPKMVLNELTRELWSELNDLACESVEQELSSFG